jgi:hypothetical protein
VAETKRVWAIYPFLLGVFPLVRLYAANADRIAFRYTVLPFALTLAVLAILHGLFRFLTKDAGKAAVLLTITAVLFFAYGRVHHALGTTHMLLWPVWAALIPLALVLVRRAKRDFNRSTAVFNVFSVAITLVALYPASAALGHKQQTPIPPVALTVPKEAPDVYYIILDAYGRDDTLRDFYGFDNGPFIADLEKRGFVVPRQSRSNYLYTILSLPSSLNLDYLDGLRPARFATTPAWLTSTAPLIDLTETNRVARSFKAAGYRYVNLPSGLSFTNQSRIADLNYGSEYNLREFNSLVGQTTMLSPWFKDETEQVSPGDLLNLEKILLEAPSLPGPKYVFAHFLSPHPPYQFKPDGSPADPAPTGVLLNWSDKKGYVGQIQYLNTFVLKAVDKIIRDSKTPPVIIIQADHGPALRDDTKSQNSLEPWTRTNYRVRSGILNAYFVPPAVRKAIPADVTPVNSFRIVFNEVFGAKLPLLKNETWVSNRADLFRLKPVPKADIADE